MQETKPELKKVIEDYISGFDIVEEIKKLSEAEGLLRGFCCPFAFGPPVGSKVADEEFTKEYAKCFEAATQMKYLVEKDLLAHGIKLNEREQEAFKKDAEGYVYTEEGAEVTLWSKDIQDEIPEVLITSIKLDPKIHYMKKGAKIRPL